MKELTFLSTVRIATVAFMLQVSVLFGQFTIQQADDFYNEVMSNEYCTASGNHYGVTTNNSEIAQKIAELQNAIKVGDPQTALYNVAIGTAQVLVDLGSAFDSLATACDAAAEVASTGHQEMFNNTTQQKIDLSYTLTNLLKNTCNSVNTEFVSALTSQSAALTTLDQYIALANAYQP